MDHGASQDYTEAAQWARRAAELGDADAQFTLGWHCSKGKGVSRDLVEAHKWYSLAAAGGHESADRARTMLERQMTREDILRAQQLVQTWTPAAAGGFGP